MFSPALQLIADRHAHLLRVLDAEDRRLAHLEAPAIEARAQHPDRSESKTRRKAA